MTAFRIDVCVVMAYTCDCVMQYRSLGMNFAKNQRFLCLSGGVAESESAVPISGSLSSMREANDY
jgi:hypothetical protein